MSGKSFDSGLCNCCGAGPLGCLICCLGPECILYGCAMSTMDPANKSCFIESVKAFFCCCSCQRTEMREKYGIEGSPAGDCVTGLCCYCCAGIQMWAQAKKETGQV